MDNRPWIKGPRQFRALETLLSRDAISVKELGPLIGARNPAQIIFELRKQGFQEIILMERFHVTDRDGAPCFPGRYSIPKELKPLAEEAFHRYLTQQQAAFLKPLFTDDRGGA